jgi:hypothetical protein
MCLERNEVVDIEELKRCIEIFWAGLNENNAWMNLFKFLVHNVEIEISIKKHQTPTRLTFSYRNRSIP